MQTSLNAANDDNTCHKNSLRSRLLHARATLDPITRAAANAAILAGAMRWWELHRPASLGVYWPIRGEPDLRAVYQIWHTRGVQLALPLVNGPDQPLHFTVWVPGQAMQTDRLGIAIPVIQQDCQPQALLIPCLGFNPQRLRLGYGGGFYDRTLALAPRPLTLGIAYDCAAVSFDGNAHDIALDAVLTESGLLV